MRRRSSFLMLFAGMLALLGSSVAVAAPQGGGQERVIVVLHDGTDAREAAREAARDHGAEVSFIYEHALQGFAATVPAGRVNALRNDARVDYVEPDRVMHTTLAGDALPTGIDRVDAEVNTLLDIDGADDVRVDARVAVIDTGVDFEHGDLNVNTALSVNCLYTTGGGPPWARDYQCVTGEGDDDNGHGTHVAGTIGALDNGVNFDGKHVVGVAPGVEIIAVKVLDSSGSGYTGGIVAGIDYITSLNSDGSENTANDVDVANMSLGGSGSPGAMEDAIAGSYNAGTVYALSAGNSSNDVTGYTPAGEPHSITVSALADYNGLSGGGAASTCNNYGADDTFASFSNFGSTNGDRVDIIAPGVCILSTVPGGGYDGTYSGTSMSAPHVAGAAALLAASGVAAADIKLTLINAADGVWFSTSDPDASDDRLLNVDDATVFKPTMVSGAGGGTETDTTAPAVPSGLAATAGDGQVVLDWANNSESDLAGYNVYRSTTSGSGYSKINGSIVSASTYTDTGLTNGTPYYYRVTAVDSSSNESLKSSEVSATPQAATSSGSMDVTEESYSQFGGKTNDNHLDVTIRVTDGTNGVGGVTVTMELWKDSTSLATYQATTDSSGYVTFGFRSIGPGCYAADVTRLTGSSLSWDNDDPLTSSGGSCQLR